MKISHSLLFIPPCFGVLGHPNQATSRSVVSFVSDAERDPVEPSAALELWRSPMLPPAVDCCSLIGQTRYLGKRLGGSAGIWEHLISPAVEMRWDDAEIRKDSKPFLLSSD